MKTWVRKSLSVGILAAAALLFAPGAAQADARSAPAAADAVLGGSQSYSPITAPMSLHGTSLGNLGGSTVDVNVGARTESAKTTERYRVAPAVAGVPVTESAAGGHGNGNGFCGNSLHFLGGGGPSFNRCDDHFQGHRGHGNWHGGGFLGDSSFGGFDDISFYGDDFYGDDFDGDDLYLGDGDDLGGDDLGGDDMGSLPTTPTNGNGGYGNVAPATGNGNVTPTTVPANNGGYGNMAPTTGDGNMAPTTGNMAPTTGDTPGDTPGYGDVSPTAGDTPGYGDMSPTMPTKPTKHHHGKPGVKPIKGNGDTTGPAVMPIKGNGDITGPAVKPIKGNGDITGPAVKPIKGNGDTTGYGDVSPATGSATTTDGGRTAK